MNNLQRLLVDDLEEVLHEQESKCETCALEGVPEDCRGRLVRRGLQLAVESCPVLAQHREQRRQKRALAESLLPARFLDRKLHVRKEDQRLYARCVEANVLYLPVERAVVTPVFPRLVRWRLTLNERSLYLFCPAPGFDGTYEELIRRVRETDFVAADQWTDPGMPDWQVQRLCDAFTARANAGKPTLLSGIGESAARIPAETHLLQNIVTRYTK